MQYSAEELAPILEKMKYGITIERVDEEGSKRVYIKGKGASEEDTHLYITIDPLLSQLASMQQQSITPPSAEEVRDSFIAAIYSALHDSKYESMALEGFNVQKYLDNAVSFTLIERILRPNITEVISSGLPELSETIDLDADSFAGRVSSSATSSEDITR